MKELLKTIGWTVLAVFAYFVLEILFNTVFRFVLSGISSPEHWMNMLLAANVILKLVVLLVFGFWYRIRESKWHYQPAYRRIFSVKTIGCLMGIGLLGQYASGFLIWILKYVMPGAFQDYQKITETLSFDYGSPVVVLMLVVVIGPIAEELLFRGVIYGGLRSSFSVSQATVISAAIFGIYHKNMVQGVYAAIFGMILAYIFEKTQTIWGSALMHMTFNLSAYLVKGLAYRIQKTGIRIPNLLFLTIYIACIALVILCIRALRKLPNRYDEIKKRMEMLEG